MTLPTLSAMQAFLSLARHLSFSKAALERGVSTSALSHALRDLEATLGVRLVNRTNRSVALTAAGEFFRVRSAAAVAEVEHAMAGIGAFRDRPVGTLRLNVPRSAADIVIRPMMATFLQRYPEIRLDIVSDDRLVDIVAEGFDAGIREGRLLAQDMIAVPVGPLMRFAVVGSPDYFATRPRPSAPRDLLSHSCICRRFPNGTAYPWTFGRGANVTTVDVSGSLVLDDRALIVAAALDGIGLAHIHEGLVAEHIANGALIRVLDRWCPRLPAFHLYYPGRRHVPAPLRVFINMALTQAQATSEE
jgi:DNA-binding transcriptional LysR family regulator